MATMAIHRCITMCICGVGNTLAGMNLPLKSKRHPVFHISFTSQLFTQAVCITAGSYFIRRHYMCHTGYHSHLGWYHVYGHVICPSKANTTLLGCIHAYLLMVHPGITLPDRVMRNGMIN